jgi:hypothetical protein
MKKQIIYSIGAICISTLIVLVGYLFWIRQGLSLSTEIVPTAEALLKNPTTIPSFILRLEPMPSSSKSGGSSDICIYIGYASLWEAGDIEEEIMTNLPSKIKLSIDLEEIPMLRDRYLYHGPAIPVKDTKGNTLGNAGIADACFKASLNSGTHLATLSVSTTSEKIYQYTWAFTS